MSSVTESVDVHVPVTTAYNQWTQFESFPQFMEGVDRVDQTSDTMTHWVTSIGGVTREFDGAGYRGHGSSLRGGRSPMRQRRFPS